MARERKGQGASWPWSESARVLLADSLRGANWPGSEKARYPNSIMLSSSRAGSRAASRFPRPDHHGPHILPASTATADANLSLCQPARRQPLHQPQPRLNRDGRAPALFSYRGSQQSCDTLIGQSPWTDGSHDADSSARGRTELSEVCE